MRRPDRGPDPALAIAEEVNRRLRLLVLQAEAATMAARDLQEAVWRGAEERIVRGCLRALRDSTRALMVATTDSEGELGLGEEADRGR